jgi:hypothetical protein
MACFWKNSAGKNSIISGAPSIHAGRVPATGGIISGHAFPTRVLIRQNAGKDAQKILKAVTEALVAFRGGMARKDDVTLVIINLVCQKSNSRNNGIVSLASLRFICNRKENETFLFLGDKLENSPISPDSEGCDDEPAPDPFETIFK